MQKFKLLSLALVVAFSVFCSGCIPLLVGAAAGAGGIIWVKGKLKQEILEPLDVVHAAAVKGLQKMELPVIVDNKDQLTAKLESEFADRARVWIDLEALTDKSTRIEIRVGTLGDEQRSREILNSIEQYL